MAKPQDDSPVLVITVGGKKYSLDITDVTGAEARAFRREVGASVIDAGELAGAGTIDHLEFVAGVKWLIDRRSNPDLVFDEVLNNITYGDVEFEDDPEQEAEGDPPA